MPVRSAPAAGGPRRDATRARCAVAVALAEADRSPSGLRPPADGRAAPSRPPTVLSAYLTGQSLNVRRHLEALRDFRRDEFGTGVARPSEGHIQAVNQLLATLRRPLQREVTQLEEVADRAQRSPRRDGYAEVLRLKSRAHDRVRSIEKVWDFYFELFGQRQSVYGEWLVACDRIALDCYQ